jgi:hypothetical protein
VNLGVRIVKKWMSLLITVILILSAAIPAFATQHAENDYTLPLEGTVLQNVPDRNIKPATPPVRNPIIPGESPTTGLNWVGFYLPMLAQYSNGVGSVKVNGKTVKAAGVGPRAPWGGQYADIVYEGILYRTGATRMTFVFSDSLDEGNPTSFGPVRSARTGHVSLRQEWQSGIVFRGGPERNENNIAEMFTELGASEEGVVFDLETSLTKEYSLRVKGLKNPENLSGNIVGLRSLIPTNYASLPHAFLFADINPYTDGYDFAYQINLDWGTDTYISHFVYDEFDNIYYRYSVTAPWKSHVSADDLSDENAIPLTFSNVIVQRVEYEYTENSKIMPNMQSVGKGNADIFIGGRYIPGYWVRESQDDPTVYYDNQGNEIQLTRGKTFIAQLPPDCLLTFNSTIDDTFTK